MLHTGLGFEPILYSTEQHFSARYGARPAVQVPYPDALMGKPWPARALQLNQYLLDGVNPDGTPCQCRQGGLRFPDKSAVSQLSKHDLVRMVVDEAVSVRICQLFVDGNHRTAILSIYEKLADAGWWLGMSAIDLYILISNRNQAEWSMVKVRMVKVILGDLKHKPDIHVHAHQIHAGQVKLIAEINTLFEDVPAFLFSQGPGMCEKRMNWRQFRRCSMKRHVQYILCMVAHKSSDVWLGSETLLVLMSMSTYLLFCCLTCLFSVHLC